MSAPEQSGRPESSATLRSIAQALLDTLDAPPALLRGRPAMKLVRAGYRLSRTLLLGVAGDPLLAYRLDGTVLQLPFSHQLPLTRSFFPDYSTNIGRIASALQRAYPELSMLDIGANVGDTVAIVRSLVRIPILCIEGDAFFHSLLSINTSALPDVELAACFIGDEDGEFRGQLEIRQGTARLVGSEAAGQSVATRRLDSVLREHPRFARSKLVKIDTDGFDTRILKAATEWLAAVRPVLFFEYDPAMFQTLDPDGFAVFRTLRSIGYQQVLVFRNTGDYLMQVDLRDEARIDEVHALCLAMTDEGYFDLCAFHSEDAVAAEAVRTGEMDFDRKRTQSGNSDGGFAWGRGS